MQECWKAAAEFERLWGYKGAEGMLNTDYASSIISVDNDEISDDSKQRRRNAEAGKGANMVQGRPGSLNE